MLYDKIKHIFNRLQDDESRNNFMYRLSYSLSDNYEFILNMLKESSIHDKKKKKRYGKQNVFQLFDDEQQLINNTVIYGVGEGCNNLLAYYRDIGVKIEPLSFCDSNTKKQGTLFNGFPVISPAELREKYPNCNIIISSVLYKQEITNDLLALGFNQDKLYYREIGELVYFPDDIIKPIDDEVFIDAGAYNGGTIKDFLLFCNGKYKKIIAFEPDKSNYILCTNFINSSQLKRVDVINKGVWSSSEILRFSSSSDWGSHISKTGEIEINVVSIDSIIDDIPVTMIKMDVEGAELEALKGAKKAITKHKPRLAVCIYHKPSDIIDIPEYILNLNKEYKLFIRHHSTDVSAGTVLYAI